MKKEIINYDGLVMIYSNNIEKLKPLMERLVSDNIDVNVEGCTRCMSSLDRCILDTINEYSPDLILIDNGHKNNGLTLYGLIKDEGTIDSIPTVILGVVDEEMRIKALEIGAIDLINSPLTEESYIKMKNYIEIGKKISSGNIYDKLTGIYTRKYAEDLTRGSIEIAIEENTSLILMLIDIDDMSVINKKLGKKKGDEVLVNSSNFFRNELDKKDFIYRYSGESFVLVFKNKTVQHVLEVGKRLQDNVNSLTEKYGVQISFSAGIAAINEEISDYYKLIDSALSSQASAKIDGKAKIYIHDSINTTKKKKHILIVDSDNVLNNILSRRYKNKGYKVSSSFDIENPEFIFKSKEVDVLIIDLELFASLQKYIDNNILDFKDTKVIVLSSSKSESALESAFKNGADQYIQKPFSIVELDSKLLKLI